MYIDVIPNRKSSPCLLLRRSYRRDGKVCKETLANITGWPKPVVAALQRALNGEQACEPHEIEITRSIPYGHVAAVIGMARQLGIETLLSAKRSRERDLVLALIAQRILDPRSKLASARMLSEETASSALNEELDLGQVHEQELYQALDWLLGEQERIERVLFKKHICDSTLLLYDVSSSYFEGRKCELARYGYSRDGKGSKLQIVYGLRCSAEGCPVGIEVFEGNTSDPETFKRTVAKQRQYGVTQVVWVGDRGMISKARVDDTLKEIPDARWITALRAVQIRCLLQQGAIQLSLFDEKDLIEISSPDYPGERLMVCLNPLLKQERARKREELLQQTEKKLAAIQQAVIRNKRPVRGKDKIALRVGKVIDGHKMAKHFELEITDDSFGFHRKQQQIDEESQLDGLYVVRTNLSTEQISSEKTVQTYKSLSNVERAFRSLKTVDLRIRPIFHRLGNRVRAHVFLCMLAYYIEWHMRQRLAPILFDDHDRPQAKAKRLSPVAKAERSDSALEKIQSKRTEDNLPVHSFQTLLRDLASIVKNTLRFKNLDSPSFSKLTLPTPLQAKALQLLALTL